MNALTPYGGPNRQLAEQQGWPRQSSASPQRQPLQQRLRRLVPCPHDTPPVRLSADPGTLGHPSIQKPRCLPHARRTYAEVAPPWAVAVDEHAAVPRVDALRRSMGDRVGEQQYILRTKIPLRSHSGALNVRLGRTPASMNISSASGTSSTDMEPSRIGWAKCALWLII